MTKETDEYIASLPQEFRDLNWKELGLPDPAHRLTTTPSGGKNKGIDRVAGVSARKGSAVAPKITEKAWQKMVIDMAHIAGWKVAHFRPGMTSRIGKDSKPVWVTPVQGDGKGFVDCVLVHPERRILDKPRLLFVELKSETGNLSKEQEDWVIWLRSAGQKVYVWRPSDFDEAKRVLGVRE